MSAFTEIVAGVQLDHAYVPSAARGVSRCACGIQFHGMPHEHRQHVAEVLAERLGVTESTEKKATGVIRVDSWKVVCQECRTQFETMDWSIFGERWYAVEAAEDCDWIVRDNLVLCEKCAHGKVCMDEDRKCVRHDLTEADDGWMYCPDHIQQGMDEPPIRDGKGDS